LGLLSLAGAAGGVALANALSGAVLRDGFAALTLLVAAQLVRSTLREDRERQDREQPQAGGPERPERPNPPQAEP
jgi:uncharacterized membrane protein YfcA